MSIKVRYFASLKETVGRGSDELQLSQPMTVRAIWQQLNPTMAIPDPLLIAVNSEYAQWENEVNNGDELAFFPPVTGG